MTNKYFTNCETIEDVKKLYKKLAHKLHPDCGGSAEEFAQMSAEYEVAFNRLKNTKVKSTRERQQKHHSSTKTSLTRLFTSKM